VYFRLTILQAAGQSFTLAAFLQDRRGEMACLFCKIVSGEISAKVNYRDDNIVIFDDINPQAPTHQIIVPTQHIETSNDLQAKDGNIVAQMVQGAIDQAKKLGLADDGYRLVMNCNQNGGQSVFHIHLHLLGGRKLNWPPG
jgi:histidine triad (HIT) family protein